MFLYSLVNTGTETKVFATNYDIGYDPINRFFYGIGGFAFTTWGTDDIGSMKSAFPTASNMKDQYWFDVFGNAKFSFKNPYYVLEALPQTTAASEYYNDAVNQGSWFGVNVMDDWLSSADDSNYGNLKTNSKWSLGPAYVIQGGPHEVVGIRANFTGPDMTGAMYYLVINRPAESTMLRYRIDPASIPSSWYQLTGADMYGDSQDAPPLVEDGDSVAFVNFIPNDHMQTYQGQDIRTQFRIGPSLIDQVMSIPLWVEPPSPPEGVAVPIMRLVSTGGEWLDTSDYLYYETSDEGMFLYSLVNTGTETKVFAEFLRHRI